LNKARALLKNAKADEATTAAVEELGNTASANVFAAGQGGFGGVACRPRGYPPSTAAGQAIS